MQRILPYLIGPELLWLLLYVGAVILGKMNHPPSKAIDDFLENFYLLAPLAVLLSFAFWYVPVTDKSWLLLRVWILGIFGSHFVLEKGLGAHSQQGPGIGTAYIVGLMFAGFILIAGSIFVKIRF